MFHEKVKCFKTVLIPFQAEDNWLFSLLACLQVMLFWNTDPDTLAESQYLRFSVLLEDIFSDLYEVELPAQEKPGNILSPTAWVLRSYTSLKCQKSPLDYWVLWISLPLMFCPEIQVWIWSLSVTAVPKQGHICKSSLPVPKCTLHCQKNTRLPVSQISYPTVTVLFSLSWLENWALRNSDKYTIKKKTC